MKRATRRGREIRRDGRRAERAGVFDGRPIVAKRDRSGRFTAFVDLRGRTKSTYRVALRATLPGGRAVRWTRSYKTCATKGPDANRLASPSAL